MTEAISEPSPESIAEQIEATSAPKKRGQLITKRFLRIFSIVYERV